MSEDDKIGLAAFTGILILAGLIISTGVCSSQSKTETEGASKAFVRENWPQVQSSSVLCHYPTPPGYTWCSFPFGNRMGWMICTEHDGCFSRYPTTLPRTPMPTGVTLAQ